MPGRSDFATTHWSLVLASGERSAEALETLCETYWYPLYAFVRRQGATPEDAQDLTQGFFARLLEKNDLGAADPQRGRFRSFLLASLRHYMANEWDRARALKRGGGRPIVSLAFVAAERRYGAEPGDPMTAERVYARRWALVLLDRVLARLEATCAEEGKQEQFAALRVYLTGDEPDASRTELAARLGMTEGALKVALHRLRKRYRDMLTAEVADTVDDPGEVAQELRDLFAALSS